MPHPLPPTRPLRSEFHRRHDLVDRAMFLGPVPKGHELRRRAQRSREAAKPLGKGHDALEAFSAASQHAPFAEKQFELNPAECISSENNRQPEQDDCDRHERRAGDVSEQDEEDRDDGEDCCDVVVHSFPIVGLSTLPCEVIWSKILEQKRPS